MTTWDGDEIDRFLFRLAQEAIPCLEGEWSSFEATARRHAASSAAHATFSSEVLPQGPVTMSNIFRAGQELDANRAVRRLAPLFAIVPHGKRIELLRETALTGSCRDIYTPRWASDPPPGTLIDLIPEQLMASMQGKLLESFSEFVHSAGQTKWMISADFSIGDVTRKNDVMCFTVFAYDAILEDIAAEIGSIFPRDLKATKIVTDEMITYLRSTRRFHFAFIVDRDRKIYKNVTEARLAIDGSIAAMSDWGDVDDHQAQLVEMRALRNEANANNFRFTLLGDMVLFSTFAAFIALLLQMEGRAELIGLFPDRDKLVTAYRAIGYQMFTQSTSAFALRKKVPEAKIALGLPGPRPDGRPGMYFDELIRIPDFIAGAIAATSFDSSVPTSVSEKARHLVSRCFGDNNNIAIIKLDVPPRPLGSSRIILTSERPINWSKPNST